MKPHDIISAWGFSISSQMNALDCYRIDLRQDRYTYILIALSFDISVYPLFHMCHLSDSIFFG